MRYKFELTEKQRNRYVRWVRTLPELPNDYFGVVGGGYWFKFIPTGLGVIVMAGREDVPEMDIDLTEYDNFN